MSCTGFTRLDLESAVTDAAIVARITREYVGKALEFDNLEAPVLSRNECTQLTYLLCEVCLLAEAAEEAFYVDSKAQRPVHAD